MGALPIRDCRPSSPWLSRPWLLTAATLLVWGLLPAVSVRAEPPAAPATVTVRRGDTLEAISQRTGVSVVDLKRLNGLKDADLLQVGQTLRLSAAPRRGGVVVIKSGDTLETIAKAHNTTVAALQKLNPSVKPENLKVGSTLRLPAPASPPASGKPPAAPSPQAAKPASPPVAKPPTTPPPGEGGIPPGPPLMPPTAQPPMASERPEPTSRGRWRYYGDTVVDWGSWKRLPDGVRFTLVQASARDVGESRALATAIAVDCSTLRLNWRVKEAWETWSVPAPRSVGQQIVLDLCGYTAADDRRPVPPPPSPTP
ncbi:MAG: LysM peptidoglycan-binding domain-containing protein [Cyanobacteriota bacterium]